MNKLRWAIIYGGTIIFAGILAFNNAPQWAVFGLTMIFHQQWYDVITKDFQND